MAQETINLSSPVLLEHLFKIPEEGYTTGSERLDGFIIGLATMLLIRSAEFVVIDLLTLVFGNRKQRIAYRVLRTWQMLNIISIFPLLSGFDSDIPCSRFRIFSFLSDSKADGRFRRFKIIKGKFATFIFIAVLCGKVFVLSAEVAIIAFAIPSTKVHNAKGGVSLVLRDSVISEVNMQNLQPCHSMFNSNFLTEFAQMTLCRRFLSTDSFDVVPRKWLPDESIRIERRMIDPELTSDAGAVLREGGFLSCRERNKTNSTTQRFMHDFPQVGRQDSISPTPDLSLINDVNVGELAIYGYGNMMSASSGFHGFHGVAIGMTPIFTDRHGMLRLSFEKWMKEEILSAEPVWTLNTKLLFGDSLTSPGRKTFEICPDAIDEIIRVTGTLDAGMTLDMFLLSTEVKLASNFSAPATDESDGSRLRNFEVGVSKRYTLSPIWIVVMASVTILLSALTASLNQTEAAMARTYREQTGLNGATSPVFIHDETHIDALLFRRGEKYHWGRNPGQEWKKLEGIYFSEDAVLT